MPLKSQCNCAAALLHWNVKPESALPEFPNARYKLTLPQINLDGEHNKTYIKDR